MSLYILLVRNTNTKLVVPVGVEPTLYGLKDRCIIRSAKAPNRLSVVCGLSRIRTLLCAHRSEPQQTKWHGWRESNPHKAVLETAALPIYHIRIKWWEWTVMLRLTQIHNLLCFYYITIPIKAPRVSPHDSSAL